jgi:hypothetical protein
MLRHEHPCSNSSAFAGATGASLMPGSTKNLPPQPLRRGHFKPIPDPMAHPKTRWAASSRPGGPSRTALVTACCSMGCSRTTDGRAAARAGHRRALSVAFMVEACELAAGSGPRLAADARRHLNGHDRPAYPRTRRPGCRRVGPGIFTWQAPGDSASVGAGFSRGSRRPRPRGNLAGHSLRRVRACQVVVRAGSGA